MKARLGATDIRAGLPDAVYAGDVTKLTTDSASRYGVCVYTRSELALSARARKIPPR
jgi:hypothetical protein